MGKPDSVRTEKGGGLNALSAESTGEFWERIVQTFFSQNRGNSDTERLHFRQFSYEEGDGPREVWRRLHDLCQKWLKPKERTKDQMLDLVILEQFVSILPPEMANWVKECGAESCSQAVALAEGFLLSQAEEKRLEKQTKNLCVIVEFDLPSSVASSSYSNHGLQQWEIKLEGEGVPSLQGSGMTLPTNIQPPLPFWDAAEPVQGPVTFEEVAVHFSQEEWVLLDPDQRALHTEIMVETSRIMASLDNWRKSNVFTKWGKCFRHKQELSRNQKTPIETEFSTIGRASMYNFCGTHFDDYMTHVLHKGGCAGAKVSEKGFAYRLSHLSHQACWKEKKTHKCRQCGKSFAQKTQLVQHKSIHKGAKPHKCQECGKGFPCKADLIRHQRVHTGEKPYKCQECGKCFAQNADLVTHQKLHTGEKPYKCQQCGKCFAKNGKLVEHCRLHTGEKPYICQDCGKCFPLKAYLIRHERLHTGEKPYECQECGKCFPFKAYLVRHHRVHTGEKPYKCQECGKCFAQNAELIIHLRIHSGEKPYKCQECGKCFAKNGHLVEHWRLHTGEKPYKCQECGKCFARNADLSKHQRIHTGVKPYKCQECGKCFARNASLVTHQRVHTGEKPYKCQECGKCFAQYSALFRHKNVHRSEKTISNPC